MNTIKIKLTQQAEIDGYDGAFLREHDESGYEMITGISGEWYSACAVDDDGNNYTVYWEMLDGYTYDGDNEDMACNWSKPYMVLDEDRRNVTSLVTIAD